MRREFFRLFIEKWCRRISIAFLFFYVVTQELIFISAFVLCLDTIIDVKIWRFVDFKIVPFIRKLT